MKLDYVVRWWSWAKASQNLAYLRRSPILLLAGGFLISCAGPITPFGALSLKQSMESQLTRKEKFLKLVEIKNDPEEIEINFFPKSKVYHDKSKLKVEIFDPFGVQSNSNFKIFFNGYDVSSKYFNIAKREELEFGQRVSLEFKNLRLRPGKENDIVFVYYKKNGKHVVKRLTDPTCSPIRPSRILNTGPFNPPRTMIEMIEHYSRGNSLNPNFVMGLIAQESGFDTKAVSWAKAIGLTQVGTLAEREIASINRDWPRDPKLKKLPVPVIRAMVVSGKVNKEQEWRLDPNLSVQGGITYLKLLDRYWSLEENRSILLKNFGPYSHVPSDVLLASYNSGAARVKQALSEKGKSWLNNENLNEAHKYVDRVKSFCFAFQNRKQKDL